MFDSSADDVLASVSQAYAARDAALLSAALSVADAIGRNAFGAAGLPHGSSWLRAYTDSSGEDARRAMSLGRLLACHRATRNAVESGALSIGRAGVIAAAVTDNRRAAYHHDEDVLLSQLAGLRRVDDVEVAVAHWCALVDQERAPGGDHAQRLYLQHRFDGGASVRGELDARTAEVVRTGLEAFDSGPDPVDGPLPARTLAERRADALGDLATHALVHPGGSDKPDERATESGDDAAVGETDTGNGDGAGGANAGADRNDPARRVPDRRGPRPAPRSSRTSNLVIDLPSLAGRSRTDLDGIVATLDGRPLAAWAVGQLLCDTWVAAVVTDAAGAVVDATDRTADFTDTQRRLIAVRDGGCVFPGCQAPPSWCDVHHLHWRSHGGGRNLDNGALLCRRHHTLLHRTEPDGSRWILERVDDGTGWCATSPTGTTWAGHPGRTTHQPAPAPSAPGREPPRHHYRPAA
jgi:hypothetical protein